MGLRLLLLTLVALLSFELPSDRDFASWTEQGNNWFGARMADLAQIRSEIDRTLTGSDPLPSAVESAPAVDPVAVELAQFRADLQFETAMEGIAASFRADMASVEAAEPVPAEAPVLIAATSLVPAGATIAEAAEPGCFDLEIEVVGPEPSAISTDPASPVERLSSAVRLTRQALSAWASLIPSTAESVEDDAR